MNTLKKSKASLALLIIALVILTITGGYFLYAQSLLKTAETEDTNQVEETNNSADDSIASTVKDESTTTTSQIPADWKSYTLTSCGIKISVPPDWNTKNDLGSNLISFLPDNINNDFARNYLTINCYDSLGDLVNFDWKWIQKKYPDFSSPKDLWDALTRISPIWQKDEKKQTVLYASNIEKKRINNLDAIQATMGRGVDGANLSIFFQREEKIISLSSDTYSNKLIFDEPQKTIISTFEWLK